MHDFPFHFLSPGGNLTIQLGHQLSHRTQLSTMWFNVKCYRRYLTSECQHCLAVREVASSDPLSATSHPAEFLLEPAQLQNNSVNNYHCSPMLNNCQ